MFLKVLLRSNFMILSSDFLSKSEKVHTLNSRFQKFETISKLKSCATLASEILLATSVA